MASSIAVIYANRIIAGAKKFSEIPENRKEEVKEVLQKKLTDGELNQARFDKIISE